MSNARLCMGPIRLRNIMPKTMVFRRGRQTNERTLGLKLRFSSIGINAKFNIFTGLIQQWWEPIASGWLILKPSLSESTTREQSHRYLKPVRRESESVDGPAGGIRREKGIYNIWPDNYRVWVDRIMWGNALRPWTRKIWCQITVQTNCKPLAGRPQAGRLSSFDYTLRIQIRFFFNTRVRRIDILTFWFTGI